MGGPVQARYAGSVPDGRSMLGMPGMRYVPLDAHTALTHWEFSPFPVLVLAVVIVAAVWYLRARANLAARGRRWSWQRTVSFLVGLVALDVALQSPVATFTMEFFQAHVVQHLLLMVVAPSPAGHGGADDPGPPDLEPGDQGAPARRPQLPSVPGGDPSGAGVVPLLLLDVRLLPDLRPGIRHGPHVDDGPGQPGLPVRLHAVLVAHRGPRPDPALADEPRGARWSACWSGCPSSRSWPWPC